MIDRPPPRDLQYQTHDNARFSILESLILTGAISAAIAAVTQLGIIGTLILFWISLTASAVLNIKLTNPTQLRCWNQFLWGGLMPLACVFADPIFFGSFVNGIPRQLHVYAFACYALIVWQIFWLALSWYVPIRFRRFNAFLGGTFLAGALFALIVGIAILPIAIIGLLALLGFLGFTPWFTAYVFYQSGKMHIRRAKDPTGSLPILVAVSGFVLPLAIWFLLVTLTAMGILEQVLLRPTENWNF